jgi:hypothetical protein
VIEQYRDELLVAIRGNLSEQHVAEDREAVASDLLNILHRCVRSSVTKVILKIEPVIFSIPIQSIATNGPSLVSP